MSKDFRRLRQIIFDLLFNDFDLAETWRGICHDCRTCTPKNVGEHNHSQNTMHRETWRPTIVFCDVQDKLHLAPQDKTAALRTAKTLLPMVLFSIWRGSPDMDGDIDGACQRRQLPLQVFSKSSWTARPRPVTMPLSYNMYYIGMRDD